VDTLADAEADLPVIVVSVYHVFGDAPGVVLPLLTISKEGEEAAYSDAVAVPD